jgi:predicted DNA-binding transcriptional regulator AlpA
MAETTKPEALFWRFEDLLAVVPLGETKLRKLVRDGAFPPPRQPGGTGPYLWLPAEIRAWCHALAPVALEDRALTQDMREAQARGRRQRAARRTGTTARRDTRVAGLVSAGGARSGDDLELVPAERGRRRSRS